MVKRQPYIFMVWMETILIQLNIWTNPWIWLSEIINYFATSSTMQSFQDLGVSKCQVCQCSFPEYVSVSQSQWFHFPNLYPSFCTSFSVITSHKNEVEPHFRHIQPALQWTLPFHMTWALAVKHLFSFSPCIIFLWWKDKQEKDFFCGGEWEKSVAA